MVSLAEADNGKAINVALGDTISIKLTENATTGYRWAVDHLDQALVETVGSKPDYPSDVVGSGGSVAFTFKAVKAGSTDVSLKYWRHFEGDSSITNRFRIQLNVQPK